MARGEGNVPGEAHRDAGAWPVMLSAVLLSGAVAAAVSAATVRFSAPEAPAIASVRLGEIAAAWAVEAAGTESTAADAAADARAWAARWRPRWPWWRNARAWCCCPPVPSPPGRRT